MTEPLWLELEDIVALQEIELARYGGLAGTRDAGALESALNRARNRWAYGEADLYALAATYAFGLARNHPFNDGNKRISALAAATFLALNGVRIGAPNADVEATFVALAAGELDETALTERFRTWVLT